MMMTAMAIAMMASILLLPAAVQNLDLRHGHGGDLRPGLRMKPLSL
ncbi:hypothetical protein ACJ72_06316 [Emergomyces africanus]|uniref:Uncharacterized protein n=1 Tax=Emergomyces africanus TaxID=1955775 RepID=A0A1B7NRU0_9EURO|nr:hypothetical protein ACJ72_06312 [Emergomyces africanus]OAX79370.1 hypothetical protein ACJ72_06316 [Emergomyces africanus]